MKIDLKGHVSMFGANAIWGVMSPIAKFVMISGTITPLVVTNLRIAGAMILFWLVSLCMKPEHVGSKDMAKLFGASLLAIIFNQGCFITGLGMTSPTNASIITTSMPLWAMVLAAFFLKEPITGKKIMGIAAGATGAVLLILGGSSAAGAVSSSIWGDLIVMTAQLSYALYIVLFKDFVSRYSIFTVMKWMFTFAFICMVPFSTRQLSETRWDAVTSMEWGALSLVVVGATFVSYILVVIGQKRLRPTVAGMYNYIQPLVACIGAILWGMDTFGITKAFAILLIFAGVFLVTMSKSRKDMEAEENTISEIADR
ncbi:DMT family transporter [Muribaculum intestinale]|jgi:drug/metabolite transporter (DMT)-like permease|uniref:DMT family transporter n=1 Tax=Muribaculum intestinale TaxID=1796646 RepID=UPI000D14017E|nr:DMT family transporter [Muribaculum intestinale]PWB04086.1 EamA/RhaT family transporter [Muribaculum intestinale]PWB10865.1 EamA/RhaT family transporter [Muribaculum intestinale]